MATITAKHPPKVGETWRSRHADGVTYVAVTDKPDGNGEFVWKNSDGEYEVLPVSALVPPDFPTIFWPVLQNNAGNSASGLGPAISREGAIELARRYNGWKLTGIVTLHRNGTVSLEDLR